MLSKAARSRHSVWLLSRGCVASAASTPVVVCAGIRTTVCTPACAGTLDPVCFPPPFVFPHLLGENRRFEASLPSTYSAPSATYLTTSLLTLLVFLPLLSILPPFVLDLFLLLSLLLSYHHSCPTLLLLVFSYFIYYSYPTLQSSTMYSQCDAKVRSSEELPPC